MIKTIQLRGISRTPSDRATADGGCAESINVHLDQNETAPTLPPKSIYSDIYGTGTGVVRPIVFVHKMPNIENYIGFDSNSTGSVSRFCAYRGGVITINNAPSLPKTESLVSVTSIGNTVIAYTTGKAYYFLYKEGEYQFLGNEISAPAIEVISTMAQESVVTGITITDADLKPENTDNMVTNWNWAKDEDSSDHSALLETMNNLWDAVVVRLDEIRKDGKFYSPFFLRFALRLYNGDYIHLSAPILCGGQSDEWIKAITTTYPNRTITVYLSTFKVYIRGGYNVGQWGDIVKSIDIFASSPIFAPHIEAAFTRMYKRTSGGQATDNGVIVFEGMDDGKEQFVKGEVLSKGQFYMIKSISLDNTTDMAKLDSGTMTIDNSAAVSGDELLAQEVLPDAYRSSNQYLPIEATHNYNSRVLLGGAKEILCRGNAKINSLQAYGSREEETEQGLYWPSKFALRYKIVDPNNGEVSYVLGSTSSGEIIAGYLLSQNSAGANTELQYGVTFPSVGQYFQWAKPYAWIAYPDTRCTEVELSVFPYMGTTPTTYRIPLEPHPLLECAYAFVGFGNVVYDGASTISRATTENRVISQANKIYQSDFENPWLFPASGIITFSDKVIDTAMTSVPLSEGQFGQFDVYVFTGGGIRALTVASDGTFLANNAKPNIAEHIALPGTITSLEQSVIFITERGVMLLMGGTVMDLSTNLNGKPIAIDDALSSILVQSLWGTVRGSAFANETLMAFMKGATPAYDSKGGRIIFFRSGKTYAYEYRLETKTWHKIMFEKSQGTLRVLNDFPNCTVSTVNSLSGYEVGVYDFSTILDDTNIYTDFKDGDTPPDPRIYGIILTRPFDLDMPDVRKSINDLRIRGMYHRKNVQYILEGSMDGINWKVLSSLRGGSYKLFRLAILTKLNPMERISWVEVDCEARYNNKLR